MHPAAGIGHLITFEERKIIRTTHLQHGSIYKYLTERLTFFSHLIFLVDYRSETHHIFGGWPANHVDIKQADRSLVTTMLGTSCWLVHYSRRPVS